ncbi:MAG: glycosyltransferase family 4 protein [Rhodospirillales bacterium]|nr:glycosyltransferase family 4 protein [Rhodospirillales bacterium]
MPKACFAVPGDLQIRTGGYAYARALLAGSAQESVRESAQGGAWRLEHLALPAAFPAPSPEDIAATEAAFAARPADELLLVDGLAFAVFPRTLLQAFAGRWVALVHHPLALETGLPAGRAAQLRESETRALALAAAVVVTSRETAHELVRGYAVPREAIAVAEPGTALPDRPAVGDTATPTLLCVATLSARKGQDSLVEALASLKDLTWRCRLVGSTDRDDAAAARVRSLIAAQGLEARVEIAGALPPETLAAAYRTADLFVLPSHYEGYGMAFAEAMSHGLPIVACPRGAVPGTVPEAAALFVEPGDPAALSMALRRLLQDGALRRRKAAAAWQAGRRLPQWPDTVARVGEALTRAAGR